jgi:L-ascorbate metabolism protein UlaG (beta-lactamase superfamily)
MANRYYNGPVSSNFDGKRFYMAGRQELTSFGQVLKWQFGSDVKAKWPPQLESPHDDHPPARVAKNAIRSTLIGHASFLLQVAGLNILIDPLYGDRTSPVSFAGPKRVNPPGIAFEKLPPIDAVLVSHSHYDHMDMPALARLQQKFQPRFVCPLGNDSIMANAIGGRQNALALDWGQSADLGQGVTVHAVPAYHWSARGLGDRNMALWCAFVIATPAGTIYHIADTAFGDGAIFHDVAKNFGPIALAHIPIGAYEPRWFMRAQHINPEEAVQIFKICGAQSALGHHWGTVQLTNEAHDQPEKDLAVALQKSEIASERFVAFRPGQVWSLNHT